MLATLARIIGKGLAPQQLKQRPPLWHADLPFVVLWSPKSGCTTVVKWFFHQLGLLDAAEKHHKWVHEYENKVFKADPGYLPGCCEALKAGRPVVKFVRDPAARAYSGYLEFCSPRVPQDLGWQKLRRLALVHLTGSDSTDLECGFSFLQFLDWLEATDLSKIDGHLRPQFLDYERHLRIEALAIEDAKSHFRALELRFGLKSHTELEARIYESVHHNAKKIDLEGPALERLLSLAVPIRRHKDFPLPAVDTRRLLGTETGTRIARLFARDYQAYPQYASLGLLDGPRSSKPLRAAANRLG